MSNFPGVTQADIPILQNYICNNDRGGFYIELYELTGSLQALLQAQISTFSGLAGGIAYAANAQLVQQLGNAYPYGGDINKFSVDVAQTTLDEIEVALDDPDNQGVVHFTDANILGAAQEAWNSVGIKNYFPGALLEGFSITNLTAPGTSASAQNLVPGMLLGAGTADYSDPKLYTAHQLVNPDGSKELTYYTDSTGRTVYVGDFNSGLTGLGAYLSIGDALTGPNSLPFAIIGIVRDLPGMSNLRLSLEQNAPPQTVTLFGTTYTAAQLASAFSSSGAFGGLFAALGIAAVQTVESAPTTAILDLLQKAIIDLTNTVTNAAASAAVIITKFLQQILASPVSADSPYYAIINNYLTTQGYYVAQPSDGSTTTAISTSIVTQLAANGVSISPQVLGQINSVFVDSSITTGGLIHVPTGASLVAPTPIELSALRNGFTDVFDPSGTLYTVGANLNGSNAGQFIVDTTGLSVPASTIQDAYASSTSLTLDLTNGEDGVTNVTLDYSGQTLKFASSELNSDMAFDPPSDNIESISTIAGVGLASSLQFNLSEQFNDQPIAIVSEADGSYSVGLDTSADSSFEPIAAFAPDGLNGDMVNASANGDTAVINTEIGDNASAEVSNDYAVAGISDIYTFMTGDGTLILDDPTSFVGTIDGFQLGDIIGLPYLQDGAYAVGATIAAGAILEVQESDGSTLSFQLSSSQNYSGDIPYVTGGGAIGLTTAPTVSDAQLTTVNAPVITYPDGVATTTTYAATVNFSATDVRLPTVRAGAISLEDETAAITVTFFGETPPPGGPAGVDVESLSSNSDFDLANAIDSLGSANPSGTLYVAALGGLYTAAGDYSDEALPLSVNYIGNSTTIDLAVSQKVYEPASAGFSVDGGPIFNFGVIHIGQSASIDVEITNIATGALIDTLLSSPGNLGEFTAENGVILAPGAVGTIAVDLNADIAGPATADTSLFDLVSHDSDLPDTSASGLVDLEADVFNYAQPTLTDAEEGFVNNESTLVPLSGPGAGVLTQTGDNSWTLDFGSIENTDTTSYLANIEIQNSAPTSLFFGEDLDGSFSDNLSGTFESSGDGIFYAVESSAAQVALAGDALELGDFIPDLSNFGSHTVTVLYSPTSVDSAGTTALPDITLTITDNIMPSGIPDADVVAQGNTMTVAVNANQDAVLDPLFGDGLYDDTLLIEGSGIAEIDGVEFVTTLEVVSGGNLLLGGGSVYTDPIVIDADGDISGYGTVTGAVSNLGTITAEGGTLELTGSITGIGTLAADPGATLQLDLGGSAGLVTIDAGTLLAAGELDAGQPGVGGLAIDNGATAYTGTTVVAGAQGLEIGMTAGDAGGAVVTGVQSLLSNTGTLVIGDAGLGSLSIQSDGTVITTPGTVAGLAAAVIASQSSASGSSVTVTGSGSDFQITGSLQVGAAGAGLLTLTNGATATAASLDAGIQAGSVGDITVTGPATALTTIGSLSIGDAGSGELSILDGANVFIGGDFDIGLGAGGSGNVDIEDTTGTVYVGGNLNIGLDDGPAVLTVGPNSTLEVDNGFINGGPGGVLNLYTSIDPLVVENLTINVAASDTTPENVTAYTQNDTFNLAEGADYILNTPSLAGTNSFTLGTVSDTDDTTLVLNADTVSGTTAIAFTNALGTLVIGADQLATINSPTSGKSETNPNDGLPVIGGFGGVIRNFTAGDTIVVDTTGPATFSQSGSMISVIENGTTVGVLAFDTAANAQAAFTTPDALVDNALCFLAGTLIGTPEGQIEVERLATGDRVLTASGAVRPVVWLGHGRVLATRGRRGPATPVIVRKGALGPNVPHRDLRVTKAHSLYIDDVLIPVEFLVNHRSIVWDDHAQEVELYHIELEMHDVLLANGAPAESYRDDGNRWLFQNANTGWGLPPQEPFAPVLTGGPIVDAAWRRLLDRAGPRPGAPLTDDPDLHLIVDGRRMDAVHLCGDMLYVFCLAARPVTARIVSRTAIPAELGLARDPRSVGVALRRIVVREGTKFRTTEASDPRLSEGFHTFEPDKKFRWTDGDAAVPAGLFSGFTSPLELVLHLGATASYLDDGAAARRVA